MKKIRAKSDSDLLSFALETDTMSIPKTKKRHILSKRRKKEQLFSSFVCRY